MTLLGRDVGEIEALVTDRYLDALLAGPDAHLPPVAAAVPARRRLGRPAGSIDDAVRLVSGRLAQDLPRFHPSFRFEERLALQLAEVAAAMRLPGGPGTQRGSERRPTGAPATIPRLEPDPLAAPFDDEEGASLVDGAVARPILIGGAVAASAISLAGAAWLAWRRRSSGAAFGRAARAAHARGPARARARPARAKPAVRS